MFFTSGGALFSEFYLKITFPICLDKTIVFNLNRHHFCLHMRTFCLHKTPVRPLLLALLFVVFFAFGCGNDVSINEKVLVNSSDEIDQKAEKIIEGSLESTLLPVLIRDSSKKNSALLKAFYESKDFGLLWSSNARFNSETDSLLELIKNAEQFGLFPSDYNFQKLSALKTDLQKDSAANGKHDATKWSYFDMLSTSAFMQVVKDLKVGRLLPDSVLVKDSSFTPVFFAAQKDTFAKLSIAAFTHNLEPPLKGYHELKAALHHFLPKANLKRYTLIKTTDSLLLPKAVYKRIAEEDSLKIKPLKDPDSTVVSHAVTKYQKWKKQKADGKISKALVKRLNETDREKFIRIAITLDKYKMLPALPDAYIWVNLPSYYMEVRDADSVVLRSKIVCGKPATRTPLITSAITDMITYPQWTIPPGIIKKEVLPALQRNPGYIHNKGFSLIDEKGDEVNPYSVNWAKYSKGIPYRVVQGSGDDNALGVMKFNFPNPHSVYLHDTNQRYLFGKSSRALSHGCVRVQQWRDLAYYLLRRDSLVDSSRTVRVDSLNSWLAQKKKKYIRVRQQLPLFIRYFSCEGRNGKLVLHEDIYEEDKRIRERLFASK